MIKFILGAQGLPDCCKRPFHLNAKQQSALRAEQGIDCPFCKKTIALTDEAERQRFANFGNPCLYITIVPRIILIIIAVSLLIGALTGYLKSLPPSLFFTIVIIGIIAAVGGNGYAQHISNKKMRLKLHRVKN